MVKVILFGAGIIGEMISTLLANSGDYQVSVVDKDAQRLAKLPSHPNITPITSDIQTTEATEKLIDGHFAVLSAMPYFMNTVIANAAKNCNCHYLDLTEDTSSTKLVQSLAKDAQSAFIPQCGLAPGFISIAAHDLAKKFESLDTIHMRVGALPLYPTNALKYNLTWSTDGLINEYCNPCDAIVESNTREVLPLEGLEAFSLDGANYEAFNTSGGLGTLCETYNNQVKSLNYKTVRYPGHRNLIKMLVDDLQLSQRRDIFKNILEHAVPATMQDLVLIFITVSGIQNGKYLQESYAKKIYHQEIHNKLWSAIQITTASSICVVLDLLHKKILPSQGFIKQEQIALKDFLNNRFGKFYK